MRAAGENAPADTAYNVAGRIASRAEAGSAAGPLDEQVIDRESGLPTWRGLQPAAPTLMSAGPVEMSLDPAD